MEVYLVGGAVRDQLLGREPHERDWVVVGSTPEEMISQGFKPVGRDFPVFLHPQTHEEYALARTERKNGKGYHGFSVYASPEVTLEEDLGRRDLTINAMAMDAQGQIIDPWGGLKDIENRVFRHVSPAFVEDPVRILRLARFAAGMDEYGFSIHHETLALLDEIVEQGEVDHLVAERVWQEFERALLSVRPRRFIEVLRQCGALKKILPELDALFGVPQRARYHPEIDTGEHTLMVLDRACDLSDSLCVRYAALMHDLGKALTPESVLPAHHGHEEAGVKPLRQISQRLRVPTACQDLAELACRYHTHIHRGLELRSKTIVELFHKLDAFRRPDRFEALLLVCLADKQGRGGGMTVHYTQQDFLRECLDAARVVSVEDLAAQSLPGNLIGKHLRKRRLDAVQKVWALWRS